MRENMQENQRKIDDTRVRIDKTNNLLQKLHDAERSVNSEMSPS